MLKRERLFAALDAAANAKAIWLAAPGGAGKSSLIATWLAARARRAIWYSLDAGDADPATFFHYFGIAARRELGVAELPPFTPSGQARLDVFARRYFERLFAAAAPPVAIVLDDYQQLAPDAPVHGAIDALLGSVPAGDLVVITSRAEPPPPLARWAASADMRRIDWPQLRLSRAETAALADLRTIDMGRYAEALYELSRGWAAGAVLLARAVARGMSLPRPGTAPPTAVFDYLAREVFRDAPQETQQFVLRTAYLPNMTVAEARAVSGEQRAGELLDSLHRGHLFTDRRDAEEPLYEYHPLFREFLQAQAQHLLDPATLLAVRRATAGVLAMRGDLDRAVPLLAASDDWAAVARLVRQHAGALAGRGRHQRLAAWLEAVPDEAIAREPWLAFWRGWFGMIDRRAGWRSVLAGAWTAFDGAGDVEGALTSAAWLLRASATPEESAHWIARIERVAGALPRFDDPECEARVIAQFHLVAQFPPHHPLVTHWAERAHVLARSLEDPALRLRMAAFALGVQLAHGDLPRMGALIAEAQPLAAGDGPPSDLAVLLALHGMYHLQFGNRAPAHAVLTRLQQLADESGMPFDRLAAWHFGFRLALFERDFDRARGYHAKLQQFGEFLPPHIQQLGADTVLLRLLESDIDGALAAARAVLEHAAVFPALRPAWRVNQAQVLLARGDPIGACKALEEALDEARAARLPASECTALLVRAAALLRTGDAAGARADIALGFGAARALGCVPQAPALLPALLAQLVAHALEYGIERDFATALARHSRLVAPSSEEERWPWPVRVRVLGGFDVTVDGESLDAVGRTQRRPIEMLKCAAALGGRNVSIAALMEALWPHAEGDAAKGSFEIALHRLRRLLRRDDAVVLDSGRLTLNPGVVWVDAAAFERLAARAEQALRAPRVGEAALLDLHDRALRLYRGPLLESDEEAWTHSPRERLRSRYLRLTETAGEALERAARFDAALDCYERAVAADPPAERIYRRLMRALLAQGRSAEALEVYQRCARILRATLGTAPSPETEALRAQLRND